MDKLKMETSDMAAENIEKIGALFPSAVTEMRGEDGSIKKGVIKPFTNAQKGHS